MRCSDYAGFGLNVAAILASNQLNAAWFLHAPQPAPFWQRRREKPYSREVGGAQPLFQLRGIVAVFCQCWLIDCGRYNSALVCCQNIVGHSLRHFFSRFQ